MAQADTGTDSEPLVDQLRQFYTQFYRDEIGELAQAYPRDQRSLYIDWLDVYRFDIDLADDLRENPGQMLQYFEEALRLYELPIDIELGKANVRITNAPDTAEYAIGETRADHLSQLISVYGQAQKRTKVKPRVTEAALECQRCGTLTRIPQTDGDFQEPHECQGCERQGPFRLNRQQSAWVDYQALKIQEPPEQATSGDGYSTTVVLEGDIVNTVDPGDRVTVNGILEVDEDDTDETTFDTFLCGNSIEHEQTDFEEIDVSEYRDDIKAIANGEHGDPFDLLTDSFAPGILGHEEVKEALILQLFGGVKATNADGADERGDSHVLLLGDPGCGKSTLLEAVDSIAPRSTFTSGKGAKAAGMTAAAVRSEFGDSEWTLEAGALVLSHKGVACVDEIDKVEEDALSSLHGALEKQQVDIAKAGMKASMPAETALLAAGNPKYGRFNPYEPIADQIDLSPTLMSRFDLMFMVSDDVDPETDGDIAEHRVKTRQAAINKAHDTETFVDQELGQAVLDQDLVRAYIAYARQNYHPTARPEVVEKIQDWYCGMRADAADQESPVPVTVRKVEALIRLAEASARVRLSNTVTGEDIERAGKLVMKSMRDVGIDPETGEFDADIVETGMSKSQRDRVKDILAIISEIEESYPEGAPADVVMEEAIENGMDRSTVEHEIDQLKQKGEVYEPQADHYRTT